MTGAAAIGVFETVPLAVRTIYPEARVEFARRAATTSGLGALAANAGYYMTFPAQATTEVSLFVTQGGMLEAGVVIPGTAAITIGRAQISALQSASGQSLVHMTKAGDAIRSSQRLGLPGNTYAGPASNANLSGWALTRRTGLGPRGIYEPIFIPKAAERAFRRPIPLGPVTTWQRLTGQQFAPRGIIDLGTGEFTRFGINRTQASWYMIDVGVFDPLIIGVAAEGASSIGGSD